jgi:hypothetical protein
VKTFEKAGYSKTPLFRKLGMKPGSVWKVIDPPENYHALVGDAPGVVFSYKQTDLDGIHIFTNDLEVMEQYMLECRHQIRKNGALWFSWYRKNAGLPTALSEDLIRQTAISLGLVDVKVCAVDRHWSALKVVWRRENR